MAKQVIEKALDILNDPANAGPAKKNYRLQMVKQIVDRHFDYREMAKRSLGAAWNKINNAQRDEFVRLFAELLEASYADKIDHYAKRVRIDYTGESLDGEYAEVRTVVVRPNDRIPLNYRLLNESGTWMVYDVTIEGRQPGEQLPLPVQPDNQRVLLRRTGEAPAQQGERTAGRGLKAERPGARPAFSPEAWSSEMDDSEKWPSESVPIGWVTCY